MSAYRVSSYRLENCDDIKDEWLRLQTLADCSFFQSWGWIGNWLRLVVMDLEPLVLKVWHENELVGLGIFVRRTLRRHLMIRSDAYFLHEYPFDCRNMVIEYNGMLASSDHRETVYRKVIDHLFQTQLHTDELIFGAIPEHSPIPDQGELDWRLKRCEESSAWSVDLQMLAPGESGFLSTLSKNRRHQVRRSRRLLEEQGSLQLQIAETSEEALSDFEGLKRLHTIRWRREGKAGSFANERWESFHKALILDRFETGEVQLLKVSNQKEVIGYLYNLVWRDRVYVLQTEFKQYEDKRIMSGYVIHVMAIAHYRQQGMKLYDLMHGDSLYKRILCDREERLYWNVVQRNCFKFQIEDQLVSLVRRFKGLRLYKALLGN